MIQMYGTKRSSAGRCYWAAEEAGVQLENVPLDMQNGAHKQPEFLKLNPNGKVPTMVEDGFALWESLAINAYLAETHKPELLGSDAKEHALVNQWSFWCADHLHSVYGPLLHQWFVKSPDNDQTAASRADAPKFLAVLDGALAGKAYLVDEKFTLADLNVASFVLMSSMINIDLAPYANINAWMQRLSERPAFKASQAT